MKKEVNYKAKLTLWINEKQKEELEKLAKKLGRNKSELVREALAKLVTTPRPQGRGFYRTP